MFPEWAIGIVGIVAVVAVAQIVVARLAGQRGRGRFRGRQNADEPEASHLTHALEDVQRRLAELEERVDFHERLLASQKEKDRLAK